MGYFKRDKLKQLIDYITEMPTEDEHKRGHKFPFLVNEIFSLDNQKINDKFFNIEEEEPEEKPSKVEKEDDEDSSSESDEGLKKDEAQTKSSDEEDEHEGGIKVPEVQQPIEGLDADAKENTGISTDSNSSGEEVKEQQDIV